MNKPRIGFYSVDITIDGDGKPYLIEINGSNAGFDGFLIAYGDTGIQDAIESAFQKFVGSRQIFVVTRLVNFGELPIGYLDKLVQDLLYFKSIENVHSMLTRGLAGTTWARMRNDRPPHTMGAPTSLDTLCRLYPRFRKVMLNVADPEYVLPSEYFDEEPEKGVISLRENLTSAPQAIALEEQDVLWMRCPTLAFSLPVARGIQVNAEFPYNAVAHNKLFTHEALSNDFMEHLPASIPIGNRSSGSQAINKILGASKGELFIRKPLTGSQAINIEILRRQDLKDYAGRITQLEGKDNNDAQELPLELKGVPELIAAGALGFDLSLVSELTPSKPIYCRQTKRYHHGCMRALMLIKEDENETIETQFLGGYWRLARVPIDGDGLLWERYVASQSQGAFCEQVSPEDLTTAERFAGDILTAYYHKLSTVPNSREDYEEWEQNRWLARYREQVPCFKYEKMWNIFLEEVKEAKENALQIKQRADSAGFRRNPSALLKKEQILVAGLPYLVKEPHRILFYSGERHR